MEKINDKSNEEGKKLLAWEAPKVIVYKAKETNGKDVSFESEFTYGTGMSYGAS